jgi:hypothetical protein
MANWIECKVRDTGQTIFVNLDMVVSVAGDEKATVIRWADGDQGEIVVEGSPKHILSNEVVR